MKKHKTAIKARIYAVEKQGSDMHTYVTDAEGIVLYANPAAEKATGGSSSGSSKQISKVYLEDVMLPLNLLKLCICKMFHYT